jgi:hypothetical protein
MVKYYGGQIAQGRSQFGPKIPQQSRQSRRTRPRVLPSRYRVQYAQESVVFARTQSECQVSWRETASIWAAPARLELASPSLVGRRSVRLSYGAALILPVFGRFKMADKTRQKQPLVVDADQFDSVLKRLIEHKPVPKKSIKASRKTKRGKILSK